ncbi:hypothetical protein F4802DRAFT_555051 [Xylaria palmicola]|nr:hypothetical protein F4802DRAFT_555051 [Xylaria palmicola]
MGPEIVSAWLQDVLGAVNDAASPLKGHDIQLRSPYDCLLDRSFSPSVLRPPLDARRTRPKMSRRRSPRKKPTSTRDNDTSEEDAQGIADNGVFDTPRPTRRGIFTQTLQNSTLPSLTSARSPTRSTNSSTTRSTSPVKGVDDLLRLQKPIRWNTLDMNDLQRRMQNSMPKGTDSASTTDDAVLAGNASSTENATTVPYLLESLIGHLNAKYIPCEMRGLLKDISPLEYNLDFLFMDTDTTTPTLPQSHTQFVTQPLGPQNSERIAQATQRLSLHYELITLQSIVAKTNEFNTLSRSEATWNEKVHGPMLDLAVRHTSNVAVENVTRANIVGKFIPSPAATYEAPFNGRMIDYAFVLRPEPGFNERLLDFVSHLDDHPTFNQSNYPPLRTWPTGIFVETKVKEHGQTVAEAKIQLGIWISSWFKRVSRFPAQGSLPFVPILLVDRGNWEVHFAFDSESRYDICGPIDMGNTKSLKDAYRLLAGLRDLTEWMATEFRAWVESCLKGAESLY